MGSSREDMDARLSKIAAQVPGMMFQCRQRPDGSRCFPFASDGIRHIYRLNPADVVENADELWNRIHPEDVERVAASIDESARTLARWQCEYRARFSDGSERWHWGTALPERQADGTILWHGFITDVTDRKLADQTHEESRALLQSVFSSVDLGVFVVEVTTGGEFRFVEINPAYERMLGVAVADARGRSPRQLVPQIQAEMAECLRSNFRRGTEADAAIEYEEPLLVGGRQLWLLTRLTPLRDAAGNVVRLVGRSLDITERKTVEIRFQSLTERLQLATEAAQVGIWDHDLVQNRIVWDKRMHVLYGVASGAFTGSVQAWRERIHPDDTDRVLAELREGTEGRKSFNTSFRIVRLDGEVREIRACAHVQRNPAGRAVRMVGVNWDVTAERRNQAEIIRARDEAEHLNTQLQEALERANELAREAAAATVAKSEFLANMSHEIRTPMNAVIGMSGLLLGTELTKEQREFAETIRSSGDGLLNLINDILDYSKIESGKLELEQRPFALRECVESAIDILAGRAAEKKVDLICSIENGVPECVIGDETRLKQVVMNLLSNAVKFTARGEVFLSVGLAGGSPAAPRLRFAVHDSGIGIPPDRMDRLFKTFSQVDASTTRQYGGTGLGLAISKRIVDLMGGRIWVESAGVGKGSVFYFEAELARSDVAAARPPPAGSAAIAGRRVLIVEDNATSARVLCQLCVSWGLTPRAVPSARDALAVVAAEGPFDVALVDAELQELGALEFVVVLRQLHTMLRQPIALLTWPGQPRVPLELPISGFVTKPVKARALLELLVDVLHGRAPAHPSGVSRGATIAADHPLSILLAEDNPVNQRVASLMLQRLGYGVDLAVNGREAVEAVASKPYDIVLMDVQMPEMDGLQATREICARWPAAKRPRIVAMTANASLADRDECLAAGMEDFLTKPVRAADLRKALLATPTRYAASAA